MDVRRGRSLYDSSAGSCYPSNRLKYDALFLCGTLSNEEGQAHNCDFDQAEGLISEAQQSAMPTDVQTDLSGVGGVREGLWSGESQSVVQKQRFKSAFELSSPHGRHPN